MKKQEKNFLKGQIGLSKLNAWVCALVAGAGSIAFFSHDMETRSLVGNTVRDQAAAPAASDFNPENPHPPSRDS